METLLKTSVKTPSDITSDIKLSTIFVPESDALQEEASLTELVPFQPEYLAPKRDVKPRNWITPSTYEDAVRRLKSQRLGSLGCL